MIFLFIACVGAIGGSVAHPVMFDETDNEINTYNFPFTPRWRWRARQPLKTTPLLTPVPYVVIHHSYTPAACYTDEDCQKAMRSMQDFHIDDRKWWDIGYHFAVGSNGVAYEGRGWRTLGAHALHFNTVSIGICLIGDWTSNLPPSEQIKTAQALIATGVQLGYIQPDYKLVGHRQVRDTECPGETLYQNIKSWNHYSAHPASADDLRDVKELKDHFAVIDKSNSTEVPTQSNDYTYNFPFLSREQWNGREPRGAADIQGPVPFVVIHHTYIPGPCADREVCSVAMQGMQNVHMDDNGWQDIGYNFAIGGTSSPAIYEGRGWGVVGAHAVGFNLVSVGISFIGDYRFQIPPPEQIELAKSLIETGIQLGYISPDYQLIGHRQATATECPGDALYRFIQTWDHFTTL